MLRFRQARRQQQLALEYGEGANTLPIADATLDTTGIAGTRPPMSQVRLTPDLLRTYFGLTSDLLRTYSGLTPDLLRTYSRLTRSPP